MRSPRRGAFAVGLALAVTAQVLGSGCLPRRVPGAEMNEVDARGSLWLRQAGRPGKWNATVLDGRVTLVNFFATWCFPCLGQFGLLGELQKDLGPSGLQVVAIGMDLEGSRVLDPFAREEPDRFPLLVADEAMRKGETPFGRIPVLPSTFLLDRSGRITRAWPGLPDPRELRDAVEHTLAHEP